MAEPKQDDPQSWPLLGRLLHRIVGREGSARFLILLGGICAVLFLLDFMFDRHGHYWIEEVHAFYGIYGFVMFTLLILLAKGLRVLVGRREDYYGRRAIDAEEYPGEQLGKADHDA